MSAGYLPCSPPLQPFPIMVLTRYTVVEVTSETRFEEITITDATTGDTRAVLAIARFTFIGAKPHTDCVAHAVVR
jgi:hypothetical protein